MAQDAAQEVFLRLHGKLSKFQDAIVLRDLEGLSTAEVARILGSTETTVRSQISTGRVKIKDFVMTRPRNARAR